MFGDLGVAKAVAKVQDEIVAKGVAKVQEEVQELTDSENFHAGFLLEDLPSRKLREAKMMRDFEQLRSAFALFDADGDGKLTEDEVIAALTRKTDKGFELTSHHAHETWQRWQAEFDLNKDGKISIDELTHSGQFLKNLEKMAVPTEGIPGKRFTPTIH